MHNNEKILCQIFATDMYIYLNEELDYAKMTFWKEHLRQCNNCKKELEKTKDLIKKASLIDYELLSEDKFEKMVEAATKKKKWSLPVFNSTFNNSNLVFGFKVAIVSVLIVSSIVISIFSEKPNPVKTVSDKILDWNGTEIKEQLNEIETRIDFIKAENMDKWNKEINVIDNSLDRLELNTNPYSFE